MRPLLPSSLPQSANLAQRLERELDRKLRRLAWRYASAEGLNMPMAAKASAALEIPTIPRWLAGQVENQLTVSKNISAWKKDQPPLRHPEDYAAIFATVPRPDVVRSWREEQVFVDQRLAGLNPMAIRRVLSQPDGSATPPHQRHHAVWQGPHGLAAKLSATLTQLQVDGQPIETRVEEGRIYVVDYALLHQVKADDSVVGADRGQHLQAPIALFYQPADGPLRALGIQVNQSPTSLTALPDQGGTWTMAKIYVQCADLNQNQVVNHLALTHLTEEVFALATRRQFASQHPIGRLLERHFTALLVINLGGEEVLVSPGGLIQKILEGGVAGSMDLINAAYDSWQFEDWDFAQNLKGRGVDDAVALPDFPFRDDGLLIWEELGTYVRAYVDLYYVDDEAVAGDTELSAWANELSAEGAGEDGGLGRVKGFPPHIQSRAALTQILHRLLWIAGPQHAAVNFPQLEYATFVPNMPGATYIPPAAPPIHDAILMELLPPTAQAETQFQTAYDLAGYHYDQLLDYADDMSPEAAPLIEAHYQRLHGPITDTIQARNAARVAAGRLPYRTLLPANIPNSTSV